MKLIQNNLQKYDKQNKIILFDLSLGGHHGNYIKYLIYYWCEQNVSGELDIIVLPQFLENHFEVIETIAKYNHSNIKVHAISEAEAETLNSRKSSISRFFRNFQEWQLFCQYAKSLQATHSLIMYLDTCEMPLAVGKRSPCPFSGIYFRPTFHYNSFANYQPNRKDRLQQIREKLTLSRILAHPQLKNIFCLDPFAVKQIQQFSSQANVVHLSDPVEIKTCSNLITDRIRKNLAIDLDRKVFLLFGALDGRKGIYQLLDAISQLPTELSQKFCLLLVGGTNASEQAQIEEKVKATCSARSLQIVQNYQFVPDAEVMAYFQIADFILAPYQKHAGMSGILLLAAAAGKPVLSSDYGLMGEMVRRYSLGLTVDSTVPAEITRGLIECLSSTSNNLGDRVKMQEFAKQNDRDRYAEIIFKNLLQLPQDRCSEVA